MFVFTVTADTFLKVSQSELAELAEDEKLLIQAIRATKFIYGVLPPAKNPLLPFLFIDFSQYLENLPPFSLKGENRVRGDNSG
ncbi:hypothetical protein [Nostoc sp.]|uniref:hypothetical protein n=1 Tax=Nostoc sp. TaxID=1180 RepID=UPI002FFA3B63